MSVADFNISFTNDVRSRMSESYLADFVSVKSSPRGRIRVPFISSPLKSIFVTFTFWVDVFCFLFSALAIPPKEKVNIPATSSVHKLRIFNEYLLQR